MSTTLTTPAATRATAGLIAASMPSGVEHKTDKETVRRIARELIAASMPSGVEHVKSVTVPAPLVA